MIVGEFKFLKEKVTPMIKTILLLEFQKVELLLINLKNYQQELIITYLNMWKEMATLKKKRATYTLIDNTFHKIILGL